VEQGTGHWEVDGFQSQARHGGWTSLAILALLNSGVKPDDPVIARGLAWLRDVQPTYTYVVGLQTMVFVAAGQKEDRERIQRNVDWLIDARVMDGPDLKGWWYEKPGSKGMMGKPDNSNTQYALLGLHEANVAGFKIPREVWESIRAYYTRTQKKEGGGIGSWGYAYEPNNGTLTMTTAGLCGLLIAGMDLNEGR
jgi:hypothetical protein